MKTYQIDNKMLKVKKVSVIHNLFVKYKTKLLVSLIYGWCQGPNRIK